MAITDQAIDQAFSDLKGTCGGVRNDYFGILYMEQEFGLERETVISRVAFGGNDYGIDGFHFDAEKRNLYLLQFKYSDSHAQFKDSFNRLIESGVERIFGATGQDQKLNQLLLQVKSCLFENQAIIDRVFVHFVFMGDPAEAEKSKVLESLREDLENKKFMIDQYFGRPVTLVIDFRSAKTKMVGSASRSKKTHAYQVQLDGAVKRTGPNGAVMTVGFIRLVDLNTMYQGMGERFFDRNIRAALPSNSAVNRSIRRSFKRIVIDQDEDASAFAFNHTGVALSAEHWDGSRLTEPRLLNGAQTVTTFATFLKENLGNHKLNDNKLALEDLQVLCRIVAGADSEFITNVTISNNRQNRVDAWNLHANDFIQLQLQDKFRDELQIYYERQQGAFRARSDADLSDAGISQHKSIELTKLAKTFLASDGEIDKLGRFREIFEEDSLYTRVFSESRLNADARHIVLCYKIQFRLNRCASAIVGMGTKKYTFVQRSRNLLWALLCQAVLNDPTLEGKSDDFGMGLTLEAQFTEWIAGLATKQCRLVLSELIQDKAYAPKVADDNYNFMKTNAAFKRSMEIAYARYGWVVKRLNK